MCSTLLYQGGHLPALGAWPWISVGGFNRNPLLFSSKSTRQKIKAGMSGVKWQGWERMGVGEGCGLGPCGYGSGEPGKQFQIETETQKSCPTTKAARPPA